MGVHVWERVFDFSEIAQQFSNEVVTLSDKVDKRVIFNVFGRKVFLVQEAMIRISQNGMAVARNHTPGSQ